MKDWTGNQRSIFSCLGARNFAEEDREENDYYATHPDAAEWLVKLENLSSRVWECACGEGHISKVLETHGIEVLSTDLIDRKFGRGGWISFNKIKGFKEILLRTHLTNTHRNLLRKPLNLSRKGTRCVCS